MLTRKAIRRESRRASDPGRRRWGTATLALGLALCVAAGVMLGSGGASDVIRRLISPRQEGVEVMLVLRGSHLTEVLEHNLDVSGGRHLPAGIEIDGDATTATLLHVPLDSAVKLLVNADLLAAELAHDPRFTSLEPEPAGSDLSLRLSGHES